jgi:hypothetical protein
MYRKLSAAINNSGLVVPLNQGKPETGWTAVKASFQSDHAADQQSDGNPKDDDRFMAHPSNPANRTLALERPFEAGAKRPISP